MVSPGPIEIEVDVDLEFRTYNARCEALAASARIGAGGMPDDPESPHITIRRAAAFEAYLLIGAP